MQTIYVVTSGEYSDYRIRAMFSTKEAAKVYAEEFNKAHTYREAEIEEWELDVEAGKRTIPVWRVCITLQDGEIFHRDADEALADPTGECEVDGPYRVHCAQKVKARYLVVTSPVSEEHAVKVAVEKRQAWLRKNGGKV